jgi:hypothetical protein
MTSNKSILKGGIIGMLTSNKAKLAKAREKKKAWKHESLSRGSSPTGSGTS